MRETRSSRCVVSGCPTCSRNYAGPPVSVFTCPQESREEWLKIIPHKTDPMPESIFVCERHFEPDDILRTGRRAVERGNVVTFKLSNPKLKPGSIPSRFPDAPRPVKTIAPTSPSTSSRAFSDYSRITYRNKTKAKPSTELRDAVRSESDLLGHDHSTCTTEKDASTVAVERRIKQNAYCGKCQVHQDGPCYEHALPTNIVYDKPPVPLAYSSLPDNLSISPKQPHGEDGLAVATPGESIIAKETLRAGMLFGPLIAPLIPLEEVEEPPRYVLWSEDTEEFQAYDLRDNYVCNWIKFIRPTFDFAQANLVAYQQQDHIYFFTVKEVRPNTELRVFIKIASNCKVLEDWVSPLLDHLLADRSSTGTDVEEELISDFREPMDLDGSDEEPVAPFVPSQARGLEGDDNYDEVESDDGVYEEIEDEQSGMDDDVVSEDDFEELEEFEANDKGKTDGSNTDWERYKNGEMVGEERALYDAKCNKRREYDKKVRDKKRQERFPSRQIKRIRAPNYSRTSEEKREVKLGYSRKNNAKEAADRVRYHKNEMGPEGKAKFRARLNRHYETKKIMKLDLRQIRRRHKNGEITEEEMKNLMQERRRPKPLKFPETHPGIQKAMAAVMKDGMSKTPAATLYKVPIIALSKYLDKAGFKPFQAKTGNA